MKKILSVFIFIFSFSIVYSQPFWGVKIPPQAGHSGEALFTNGTGTLYWGPAGGGGGFWSLTGNSGTDESNFIGTTDNIDITIKRNNAYVFTAQQTNNYPQVFIGDANNVFNGTFGYFDDYNKIIRLNDSITVNDGKFQLIDGTQAAGKVLTSDASGNATWQYVNSKFRIVSADLEEADSTLNGGTVSINNGASNWTFYLPGAGSLPAGFEITINRLNSTSVGTVDVTLSGAGVLQDLSGTYSSTFSLASWGTVGRSMTWVSDGNLIWYLKSGGR